MVIDVARLGRLNDEDILVADGLADGNARFVVGVLQDHDLGQLDPESVAVNG
jgi:hypothetical protein